MEARTWFTSKQRVELWDRWKKGQCIADIARALERRNKSGVYRVLALNGGIAPAERRRAPVALGLEEREEISRGIAAGRSIRRIAARLGRAAYVIEGEVEADAKPFAEGQLLVFGGGEAVLRARRAAQVMLLGGEPVGERHIEWNFVSSSKERVAQAKADWRAGRFKLRGLDDREFIPLPA